MIALELAELMGKIEEGEEVVRPRTETVSRVVVEELVLFVVEEVVGWMSTFASAVGTYIPDLCV